jgi:hypothetical protein
MAGRVKTTHLYPAVRLQLTSTCNSEAVGRGFPLLPASTPLHGYLLRSPKRPFDRLGEFGYCTGNGSETGLYDLQEQGMRRQVPFL